MYIIYILRYGYTHAVYYCFNTDIAYMYMELFEAVKVTETKYDYV